LAFINILDEVAVVNLREAKISTLKRTIPVNARKKRIMYSFPDMVKASFILPLRMQERKAVAKKHLQKARTKGLTSPPPIVNLPTRKTVPHMTDARMAQI